MFNTGARVSEIIGVRVADVVLGPTSSIRLHGKGRKQRSLPLWKTTARAVRDWLHTEPAAPGRRAAAAAPRRQAHDESQRCAAPEARGQARPRRSTPIWPP